jgi:hypothetical protein
MANRPVFIPLYKKDHLVEEIYCDFKWNPGFAPIQKKKNIIALHESAQKKGYAPLLEVSSKSEDELGQRLSAFSLQIETDIGPISIESAFQGSKVFQHGGPYIDLYKKTSREAKKDVRIRNSGKLIGFDFMGTKWKTVPKTAFYDWLYIKALYPHREYLEKNLHYKGFTDIEFNPKKSINCQARTCALLASLIRLDLLDKAMSSQAAFIKVVMKDSSKKRHSMQKHIWDEKKIPIQSNIGRHPVMYAIKSA